jgi:hypothetical protein
LTPKEKSLAAAAAKAGMDEKTARKYRRLGQLPSTIKTAHTWRTRPDPRLAARQPDLLPCWRRTG